jgi:hypothetical protein
MASWQLRVEFGGGAGEAHRGGESAILPFFQLLGDDIDADLIVFERGDCQEDGSLTQEWNKLPEHGMGSSRDEGDGGTAMARK